MQLLLLLLSSLQTHCKTIGNGLLLPDYLVYLKYSLSSLSTHSKLFSNLASRFQAVLDRYASLRKMTTKSPVLNDAVSSLSPLSDASFDWDSFQSVLSLLLYLDNFLLVLRQSHAFVLDLLQTHRSLFSDLATGGDGRTPGDSSLSLSTLLLMMHSGDSAWRTSILSVGTATGLDL